MHFAPLLSCAAVLALCATSAQAATVLMREERAGEFSLNGFGAAGFETTTISLYCTPAKDQYAIVMISPEVGRPNGATEVTLASGSEVIATRRFDPDDEALILLADGSEGRGLADRVSAAPLLAVTVSGRRIAFALSDGGPSVAAFRAHCRFGPG